MITINDSADRVMDALGHQTRRDILQLLRGEPLAVGAIAEQLPISRPAVSKHLRILKQAGLVEYDSSGTRNFFRLQPSGFQMARQYLENFWDQALVNFQQVAESLAESDL